MSRVLGSHTTALMAAAKSAAATATGESGVRMAGILKPTAVSAALGKFLGVSEISRTQAVKKIWEHIKGNNLQERSQSRKRAAYLIQLIRNYKLNTNWMLESFMKLTKHQNPSNKKEIICDDKLKSIFDDKEKVGFLEIAKLLKPHFDKSQ